jgi:hypothetical protein
LVLAHAFRTWLMEADGHQKNTQEHFALPAQVEPLAHFVPTSFFLLRGGWVLQQQWRTHVS